MEREDAQSQLLRKHDELLAAQAVMGGHADEMALLTSKCEALQWELVKFTGNCVVLVY